MERLQQGLDLIDYHWVESEEYQREAGLERQEILIDAETIERLKALGYL